MAQINTLKSEIEINQHLIEVNDIIFYVDGSNFMEYKVTELFEGGIEVKALNNDCNIEINKFEDLYFHQLQCGWVFSNDTRILKKDLI